MPSPPHNREAIAVAITIILIAGIALTMFNAMTYRFSPNTVGIGFATQQGLDCPKVDGCTFEATSDAANPPNSPTQTVAAAKAIALASCAAIDDIFLQNCLAGDIAGENAVCTAANCIYTTTSIGSPGTCVLNSCTHYTPASSGSKGTRCIHLVNPDGSIKQPGNCYQDYEGNNNGWVCEASGKKRGFSATCTRGPVDPPPK